MKRPYYLLLILMSLLSCNTDFKKNNDNNAGSDKIENNQFTDPIVQKIYTAQDQRNTTELLGYLSNSYPEYRQMAAMAFASVQDSLAVMPLVRLLTDENEEVRIATAYSLGQIGHLSAETSLIDAYQNENSQKVKKSILEALGRCGSEKGLQFLSNFTFSQGELTLLEGQAWGLSRYGMRGITSRQATQKVISLVHPDIPERVRFISTNYLIRARNINLSPYSTDLQKAFSKEGFIYTRMNLALSFRKTSTTGALKFLKQVMLIDYDYRIKVNALLALSVFSYDNVSDVMFKELQNENSNIALTASLFFLKKGIAEDAQKYYEVAKKITNWEVRTNMFATSLKYIDQKEEISNAIISGYKIAENQYEKASLLHSLAGDPRNYKFVESQVFSKNDYIIKTEGMRALVEMRRSSLFEQINRTGIANNEGDLREEFGLIFKKAINSNDAGLITETTPILIDSSEHFREIYDNTYFMTQAKNNCSLPRDIEAFNALEEAIAAINGEKDGEKNHEANNNPINWKAVSKISPTTKVTIQTSKGNIVVQLNVNESPGAVSNFLRLIKNDFYLNNFVHRVVPNFVMQSGCPRGDGVGGPDFSIRSEFSQMYYEEGSLGMASAGKDTEASQWFITLSPTSHLDGRYTIFGLVVEGMDVAHKIEKGDAILGFTVH